MSWDTELASGHIAGLCSIHGVVSVITEDPPYAIVDHKTIHIPPPTTDDRYLSCLHELGHIVEPLALKHYRRWDPTGPPGVTAVTYLDGVLMEAAAWGWAYKHIHPELEPALRNRTHGLVGASFVSHLVASRDEKHGCIRRPR